MVKPKYKKEFSPETWMEISQPAVDQMTILEDEILMYQFKMLQKGIDKSPEEWFKEQMAQTNNVNKGIMGIIRRSRPQILQHIQQSMNEATDIAMDKLHEVNKEDKPIVISQESEEDAKIRVEGIADDSLKMLSMNHSRITSSLPAKIYTNIKSNEGHLTWTMEEHLKEFHKAIELAYKKELPNMTSVNYANGRNVSFKSYVEMAIRTEVNNVAVNMMTEGCKGLGIVLFLCSTLSDSAPDHAPYQGKVYILENWRSMVRPELQPKYEDLIKKQDIKTIEWVKSEGTWTSKSGKPYKIALGVRPNCRHTFTPITYDQALNPGQTTKDLGISDTKGKYNKDHYVQMQKQRGLERKIRQLKLDYNNKLAEIKASNNEDDAMSLNGEADNLKKEIRAAQGELRDLINQHPYLVREYGRENPLKMAYGLGIK